MTSKQIRCDIFCTVIDNFGDAGVCWRLSRQLVEDHGWAVCLYIDAPEALDGMVPGWNSAANHGVHIEMWHEQSAFNSPLAQVVIEAFACDLPQRYIDRMWSATAPPVWVNLEYLSAESWIDDCHGRPSPYQLGRLHKHFFFPGFSPASGGLLCERGYAQRRHNFSVSAFRHEFGLPDPHGGLSISLFCYPSAPTGKLFHQLSVSPTPIDLLLPGKSGAAETRGNLRLIPLPFLTQPRYDELLWACDLNFVRGEDSFVRAQLAGKPFVWNIYPQDENAHMAKLDAFLGHYFDTDGKVGADGTAQFWHAWNGDGIFQWPTFAECLPDLAMHAKKWAAELVTRDDLAAQLVRFCRERLESAAFQNPPALS